MFGATQLRMCIMLQDRFYFLHITKTAGTYIWGLISKNFKAGDAVFWSDKNERNKPISIREHLSRGGFCGHNHYGLKEVFPNDRPLFIFTMLRHPSERFYSQYASLVRARPDLNLSLRDFVLGKNMMCPPNNIQTRMIGSRIKVEHVGDKVNPLAGHYLKRSIELENIDDVLNTAIDRIKAIDCFGIVERITESGEMLSNATGMSVHFKPTSKKKYLDTLSGKEVSLINSINGADRELYAEALLIFNSRLGACRAQG